MIHDSKLLDKLDSLPREGFSGEVFRATRKNLHPLAGSTNGGRWMPVGGASVLYTSLKKEGALAELAFHWSQQTPYPSKAAIVHKLEVATHHTLRLIRADLNALGVNDDSYAKVNQPLTQAIGAAVEWLGCDGLIAPSARWDCDHLILFPDSIEIDLSLKVSSQEEVDWLSWAKQHGFLE